MTGLTIRRFTSLKYKLFVTSVAVFALVAQPLYSAISASVANALSSIHTTSLQGWDLTETRTTGHNQLVAGGLHVWTESNGTTDKAAGYYATAGLNLSDVDSASIDFASFEGGRPGLQLKIDRDGNGSWDGNLVYEPWAGYGADSWWTNKSGFGVSNKGFSDYMSVGTLAEYQSANPAAKVQAIGYSLGSGVKGDAIISKMTFGETSYTFNLAPLNVPTNLKPATGSATNNPAFPMTWNAVAGATKYEYRASYSQANPATLGDVIYSDSSESGVNYTLGATTITRTNSGTPAADYYWQVRAGNASQWSDWSAVSRVVVEYTAPTVSAKADVKQLTSVTSSDPTILLPGKPTVFQADLADTQSGAYGAYIELFKANWDGSYGTWVKDNTSGVGNSRYGAQPKLTYDTLSLNGKYGLKIVAQDNAGNSVTSYRFFTVDNTIPTVTVKSDSTSTIEGTLGSNPYSRISFKLYDAGKNLKEISLNGHSYNRGGEWNDFNWVNITKAHLIEGENTVVVRDTAGNESKRTFTYDSIAPNPPVHQSPAKNNVQKSNDFLFDWSDVAGAVRYELQNSQNSDTNSDGSFTNVQWTGDYQHVQPTVSEARSVGANGTWYWQVRAVDAAGNKSAWTEPWKVTIDQDKPSAPVLKLNNQASSYLYTNDYNMLASWTIPSADTAKYNYKYWNNIATSAHNSEATAWNNNGLTSTNYAGVFNQGEGEHYVQVRAIDEAGNESDWSNKVTVVYDTTVPTVSLTNLTNGQILTGESQVRMSAADENLVAYSYRIRKVNADNTNAAAAPVVDNVVSSASNINNQQVFTWDTASLGDGKYYVYVSARDKAGNRTEQRTYVTVDNTAPVPTIISALYVPGITPAPNTIDVQVTTDEVAESVTVRHNDVSYPAVFAESTSVWSVSIPVAGLTGLQTLYAIATDQSGNTQNPGVLGTVTIPTSNNGSNGSENNGGGTSGGGGTESGGAQQLGNNLQVGSTISNSTPISTLLPVTSLFSATAPVLAPSTTPTVAVATDAADDTVASVQGLSTVNSNESDDAEGEVKAAEDTKASWSLGNLVLTAISTIAGLMALLGVFRKRETDEVTHTALRAVVIMIAAGAVIAYLLTNDFAAPMAWFSMWSIAYAVAAIAQISIIANLKGSAE